MWAAAYVSLYKSKHTNNDIKEKNQGKNWVVYSRLYEK